MSVGDRSTMQNGTAVTMPAVKAMLKTQERAAEECGVGFWNTYEAMGGNNSMPKFVERHWAAKDYTHIGYPGGKYIAEQFVKFINAAVENVREQDAEKAWRAEQLRREEEKRRAATLLGRGTLLDDSLSDRLREVSGGAFSFGTADGKSDVEAVASDGAEEPIMGASGLGGDAGTEFSVPTADAGAVRNGSAAPGVRKEGMPFVSPDGNSNSQPVSAARVQGGEVPDAGGNAVSLAAGGETAAASSDVGRGTEEPAEEGAETGLTDAAAE